MFLRSPKNQTPPGMRQQRPPQESLLFRKMFFSISKSSKNSRFGLRNLRMERRRLVKRQRIFRAGAAKSSACRRTSSSAKPEIVRVIRKHIGLCSADSVDRDDNILGNIDRVSGKNISWTSQGHVGEKVNRAVAAACVKLSCGVRVQEIAGADVERSIRPERADFYNVAVKRGGVDVYCSGKSGRFNVHRALIGLYLSANKNLAVAGGRQHRDLTAVSDRIEHSEKLRAAVDVNTTERLDLDLVSVHSGTSLEIIAGLSPESAVRACTVAQRHGRIYLDVVYGAELNFTEIVDWRCQREISARAASVNEKLAEIREADAR